MVEGFDVRVCDDEGRPLPAGEVGWLRVRGGARAQGYWHHHDKSCSAFRGEWYVSGDMLRANADGTFTYCGRSDDMMKVAGRWLAPAEVENCLLQHPAVVEAAVVGVVDGEGLTKPQAFVIANASAEELRQHVLDRLGRYKVPREVHVLSELPRTHLGKVDRGALRITRA